MTTSTTPPVEIAAMPRAGVSKDGKLVFFDFAGHDGRTHKFKVTHEAMPTIVELLIKCATEAQRLRGDDFKRGQRIRGRQFESDRFTTGVTADGSRAVLTFESPGRQPISIPLDRDQCSKVSLALADLAARLAAAPNTSRPN